MTKQEIRDIVTAMGAYTELTGTSWDGSNKYKTSLSANLALILSSTRVAGLLVIEDNNSYTLAVNAVNIPINATTPTVIGYTKANGIYYLIDKDGLTIAVAADETAPTVSSATAIDVNTIRIVFSESMGAVTTAGHSFKQNGTPITPDSVSGSGTTWDFVVSETLLNTDTILRSYDSSTGATTDLAGNELASYTDQSVTNSIGGAIEINFDSQINLSETANVWTAPGVTGFNGLGLSAKKLPAGAEGRAYGTFANSNERNVVFGFREANIRPTDFSQILWGIYPTNGGELFVQDVAGSGLVTTGYTLSVGEHYAVYRTGGTIKCQTSADEVTWTDRHTFAASGFDETGDLFIVVTILGSLSANPGQMTNPRGTNIVDA